jgi:hypothetical protein
VSVPHFAFVLPFKMSAFFACEVAGTALLLP